MAKLFACLICTTMAVTCTGLFLVEHGRSVFAAMLVILILSIGCMAPAVSSVSAEGGK